MEKDDEKAALAKLILQEDRDFRSLQDEFDKLRPSPFAGTITTFALLLGVVLASYFGILERFTDGSAMFLVVILVTVIPLIFDESQRTNRRIDILFKIINHKR